MCTSEPVPIRISSGLAAVGVAQHVGAALDRVVGDRRRVRASAGPGARARAPSGARSARARSCQAERGLVGVGRADHVELRHRPQPGELLDRLVRRAVLAEPDRVVRVDEDRRQLHQRGEPDRAAHVVARRSGRSRRSARKPCSVEAVDDRAHRVLADAEVEVAARRSRRRSTSPPSSIQCQRRGRQVGRAADQLRAPARPPTGSRSREALRVAIGLSDGVEARARSASQPSGSRRAIDRSSSAASSGCACAVGVEPLVPLGLELARRARRARGSARAPRRARRTARRDRPAVGLLGQPHLLLAERRAVRAGGVLLVRAAVADVRADDDQRRAGPRRPSPSRAASSRRSSAMSSPRSWTCQP